MANQIHINNIDISTFGITPIGGYLESLFSLPEKVDISVNEWYEGQIEVDLPQGITFENQREITIKLYCNDFINQASSFVDFLMLNPYYSYLFEETGDLLQLRFVNSNHNRIIGINNVNTFDIVLMEENWSRTNTTTITMPIINNHCVVNGTNINEYGFVLSQGMLDNVLLNTNTHERLIGALSPIKSKIRNVGLKLNTCSMDMPTFKNNYYAMIGMLTSAGVKTLQVSYNEILSSYNAYFDSVKINTIKPINGLIWADFTLNMNVWR